MNVWSTEHLPRRDRFACWREERGRRLCGAEIEVAPERRLAFSGRIASAAVGGAMVVDLTCSPYALRRTQRTIERAPEGTFAVWQVTRGGGLLVAEGGEEAVGAGAITSGRSDLPYAHIPNPGPVSGFRAVRIPLDILPPASTSVARLAARKHAQAPGIDALFAAYFASFMEQVPRLAGAPAEQAVRTLAHLALAARGAADPREETGAAAIRRGLLDRAHRLIERDLHRADLTPARIAASLGVSVRKLHLVFEPSGESVSRRVLARRLARADRLLRARPDLTVTEVAYACGFDGLSTFFRGYRAAFGAAPGERRSIAVEEDGPGDPA